MVSWSPADRSRLNLLYAAGLATMAVLLGRLALFDYGPSSAMFHPHGYCYLWMPDLVAAHVISDALIGGSYLAISATLAYLVWRARRELPFSWIFGAFGVFIVACGATHFMEIWTLWSARFWLSADVKIITAVASVLTAVVLPPLVPKAMQMIEAARTSEHRRIEIERLAHELEARVDQRTAELRDALKQAEDANRQKENFLALVSHELRTPLNAILGWAQILGSQPADPKMARGLEVIGRNARAQLVVVEALLDMSRMTMDKVVLDRVRLNLSDVIRDSVEALLPVAAERSVAIDVQLPASAPHVRGDALRLQQVFWNVLTNAVKFTPAGGHVDVTVTQDDRSAIVDIEDTGVGIDPAFLTRVFEPFSQQDQSLTRVVQGLGLGLAIAQHLVQLHDGTITAHSEGRGRGARFRVTLPLA